MRGYRGSIRVRWGFEYKGLKRFHYAFRRRFTEVPVRVLSRFLRVI